MSNTAYWGVRNRGMQHKFADIIGGNIKSDNRTGDEIAADTISKLGLKVKGGTNGST